MNWHTTQTGSLALGLTALLAVIACLVAFRRSRAHGDWDGTSSLVFLTGILGALPTVLFILVSGRPEQVDTFGNELPNRSDRLDAFGNQLPGGPLSSWAHQVSQMATALTVAAALIFFVQRLLRGARINLAPVIAITLWLEMALANGLNGYQILTFRQLGLLAVLLAASVARPGRSAFLGAAAVGLVLTISGGLLALVRPDHVFHACRQDKCGPFGALYTGVFVNGNIYGELLALSVPFIWLSLRGRVRAVLAGYVVLVVIATDARAAALAAVSCFMLLVLSRPHLPQGDRAEDGVTAGRTALAGLVTGCAAVGGFFLPYVAQNYAPLSARSYAWRLALEQLSASPILGFGADAWQTLHLNGQIPVALSISPHNQWMDVRYAGGMVGLALFTLLITCILLRGGRANFVVACCVMLPVLVSGVLGRPWSFGISDTQSFLLVAATLVPVAVRIRTGEDIGEQGRQRAKRLVP
ncbi:O-antigen ligase family protein [Streptomyces aquilus]|uniref:O-antigen ligase family protein n=1 Tax=Streptomyces aquilus TaxID=2548456 RepID=UPI0036C3356B